MPVILRNSLDCFPKLIEMGALDLSAKCNGLSMLRIGILNLMPTVQATECHLAQALNAYDVLIEPIWIELSSRPSTRIGDDYRRANYIRFDELDIDSLDGFVITGAPVEHLPFEEVSYWEELGNIFGALKRHNIGVLAICWAAQALMYYNYGLKKHVLEDKCFGVFEHYSHTKELIEALPRKYYLPHSRYTGWSKDEVLAINGLDILLQSDEAGIFAIEDCSNLYFAGHAEYDKDTLLIEYQRDLDKGIQISPPIDYIDINGKLEPANYWEWERGILFYYWINKLLKERSYERD